MVQQPVCRLAATYPLLAACVRHLHEQQPRDLAPGRTQEVIPTHFPAPCPHPPLAPCRTAQVGIVYGMYLTLSSWVLYHVAAHDFFFQTRLGLYSLNIRAEELVRRRAAPGAGVGQVGEQIGAV